jgi:hypothetical protein
VCQTKGAFLALIVFSSVFVPVIRLSCCGKETKSIVCRVIEASGGDCALHYRSLLSDFI